MARIDALFKMMQEQGASDLHLSTVRPPSSAARRHVRLNFSPSPRGAEGHLYEILSEKAAGDFEARTTGLRLFMPGFARFPATVPAAQGNRSGVPHYPRQDTDSRRPGPRKGCAG